MYCREVGSYYYRRRRGLVLVVVVVEVGAKERGVRTSTG